MKNQITIHGYFGRDPELTTRQGQNGPYDSVSFSVGVSRDFGDETDWFYCVCNGKRAAVIDKYFSKGSQIIVTGRMESYKPKKDPDHTAWLLRVEDFDFCDSKDGSRGQSNRTRQSEPAPKDRQQSVLDQFDDLPDSFEEAEDDIPF